jgi:hypothetical protein
MSHRLLINEAPLQVLPSLAAAIGLNEAIIIQQVHYWMQRSPHEIDGRKWVYNTAEEWQEQFPFWSLKTVRRTLARLRDSGLLLAEKKSIDPYNHTLYYSIDYRVLEEGIEGEKRSGQIDQKGIGQIGQNRSAQNDQITIEQRLHTETTTERGESVPIETHVPGPRSVASHPPDPRIRLEDPPQPPPRQTVTDHTTMDPRKLRADGTYPPESGQNPYQVYREVFAYTPSRYQIRTLQDKIRNLDKWRRVCQAWALRGYRCNNIQGLLDWYEKGVPVHKPNGPNTLDEDPFANGFTVKIHSDLYNAAAQAARSAA